MAVVEPDKMLVSSFPNEGLRSIALDVEVEQFNYYSFTQLYNTIKIVWKNNGDWGKSMAIKHLSERPSASLLLSLVLPPSGSKQGFFASKDKSGWETKGENGLQGKDW